MGRGLVGRRMVERALVGDREVDSEGDGESGGCHSKDLLTGGTREAGGEEVRNSQVGVGQ